MIAIAGMAAQELVDGKSIYDHFMGKTATIL
jgi:hypothetical protein